MNKWVFVLHKIGTSFIILNFYEYTYVTSWPKETLECLKFNVIIGKVDVYYKIPVGLRGLELTYWFEIEACSIFEGLRVDVLHFLNFYT